MTVGIARLSFRIHGNRSLKGKRKVVKSLIERSRNRFHVAIAEVADQELYQRVTLGVAVVGSDARVLNSVLDRLISYMDSLGLAELEDQSIELMSV